MKRDPREGIPFRAKTPEAACVGFGARSTGVGSLGSVAGVLFALLLGLRVRLGRARDAVADRELHIERARNRAVAASEPVVAP